MAEAAHVLSEQVTNLKHGEIHASPSQPRKRFNGIEELAHSITRVGLIEPVIVRASRTGHELVDGERRWRAAKIARLTTVPAIVRDLTDRQVMEIQIETSLRHNDLHPLEEADGFAGLLADGMSEADIAARFEIAVPYVKGRLKLRVLGAKTRDAFWAGKVTERVALAIARIPSTDLQDKALREVTAVPGVDAEAMSERRALEHIQRSYTYRLDLAPFKTTDESLVPAAGSCAKCPKRTGNQRDLFPDIRSPDVCSDPTCYEGKTVAAWEARVAAAKVDGRPVLPASESSNLFHGGSLTVTDGTWVDLDERNYADPSQRTWRLLLKRRASLVTLAQDDRGGAHELVDRREATRVLVELGHDFAVKANNAAGPRSLDPETEKAQRKVEKATHALRREVAGRALAALVTAAESSEWNTKRWMFVVHTLAQVAPDEVRDRRGVGEAGWGPLVARMNDAQIRGLLLELALSDDAYEVHGGYDRTLKDAVLLFGGGMKLEELEASVASESAVERATAAARSTKRKCTTCGCSVGKACKDHIERDVTFADGDGDFCAACAEMIALGEADVAPAEKATPVASGSATWAEVAARSAEVEEAAPAKEKVRRRK